MGDNENAELLPRAPVVTVRVTSITARRLFSITFVVRKSPLAKRVALPSISVRITSKSGRGIVTFLDTPGHEAFTAMRAAVRKRPISLFWLSLLTMASCRKPRKRLRMRKRLAFLLLWQSTRSINREPTSIALRRNSLAEDVIPEEYGGDIPFVPVSAKSGQGIDSLLENVLLQAEILELTAPGRSDGKRSRH